MKHTLKKLFLCLMTVGLIMGLLSFDDGLHLGSGSALAATTETISAPATVHVKRVGNSSLQLRWDKVGDVSGYEIYRYVGVKKLYMRVKVISKARTVKWTDKNRKTDTTYTYKVRAFKRANGKIQYSPFTYIVSARPYSRNAVVVNAGSVECSDTLTLGIRQKVKVSAKVRASSFGTAKKKKVVSSKIRLLLGGNSTLMKDGKGNIIGKDAGTVNLYVVAHNGNMKKVKVTVVDYAKPTEWTNLDQVDPGVESVLEDQKDDITAIASYLTKNFTKMGEIYLDSYQDADGNWNDFLSNEDNINISGIQSAINRLMAECPYGVIIYVSDTNVDFHLCEQGEYGGITIYSVCFSAFYNYSLYPGEARIAPYWLYSKYVGV